MQMKAQRLSGYVQKQHDSSLRLISQIAIHDFIIDMFVSQDGEESVPSWELRVEGRLLEDVSKSIVKT